MNDSYYIGNVFYPIVENELPGKKSAVSSNRLKWISHKVFIFLLQFVKETTKYQPEQKNQRLKNQFFGYM